MSKYKNYTLEECRWQMHTRQATENAVKELIMYHVNRALSKACTDIKVGKVGAFGTYWNRTDLVIDENSILNCYNADNII